MKKLLVLGIGNILLGDEGVGVHAVEELKKEEWPENVHLVDGGTFTHDIFHILEGYDGLLVLDIVHGNKEPGTMYYLEEKDIIQNDKQRLSLHDIDLIDSLNMAGAVGKRPDLRILGMEPENYTEWSMEMTDTIKAVFPEFLEGARIEIKKYIEEFKK
ncbi:NiFeSe hydrogenase maturation protease [Maridesulfovibrio hydrothermalis]|uniref:Hydrogenase maturation protease n=1 Tax=Maridesulfovibrio hydrothermalis AM13 = DSM 14728 TaxID=1121451 RepID=L0RDT3_9BACT|nr:NiFeSe hydrogenase maturation protease [Maridesulfovibrio hydrothermalis]CCO24382.1 Hydrogenase maturation protease [Maridesulfovibrio hydrothermalis AM13 = DSM 14728]